MTDIGHLWAEWPYARIRRELDTEDGRPVRFIFQLEYDMDDSNDGLPPHDWRQVARFDHDLDGPHNVAVEGLHLDVYREGEKYMRTWSFPEVPLREAPDFCQQYLLRNADFLINRFEKWHSVGRKWV